MHLDKRYTKNTTRTISIVHIKDSINYILQNMSFQYYSTSKVLTSIQTVDPELSKLVRFENTANAFDTFTASTGVQYFYMQPVPR